MMFPVAVAVAVAVVVVDVDVLTAVVVVVAVVVFRVITNVVFSSSIVLLLTCLGLVFSPPFCVLGPVCVVLAYLCVEPHPLFVSNQGGSLILCIVDLQFQSSFLGRNG